MGDAPAVHRAGVRALVGLRGRGRSSGRCSGHQLHRRAGPDPDEGSPVRHRGQAPPGRVPHRRSRPDQPGAQHPRRPRRRHGRRRHGMGDPVRTQRPGGRRPRADRPPRRRGDRGALLRRPGRVPDHAHPRDDGAARGRAPARVRRRPTGSPSRVVRPAAPTDDRRRPEPGQLHEGPPRPASVLRPAAGRAGRRVRGVGAPDGPPLRRRAAVSLRGRRRDHRRDGHDGRHGDRGRRSPPRARPPGGLGRGDKLPAVPGRRAASGRSATPAWSR